MANQFHYKINIIRCVLTGYKVFLSVRVSLVRKAKSRWTYAGVWRI